MRVLDLFSGTGSATQAFRDRGHEVITVDNDDRFDPDICMDIMELTPADIRRISPTFIWASPPCQCFSVASIGTHWGGGWKRYEPKTQAARDSLILVEHVVRLVSRTLYPGSYYFIIENPRGVLRAMPMMRDMNLTTVTYCQYGDTRMKPTDLWYRLPPTMRFRPMCKNGDPCHERAPRGARTGTQGLADATERGRVPYELGLDLCLALEGYEISGEPRQEVLL